MTYQVSRNGQMYGPYTLDDLRRYVASGNILLTDMAKSEEMPDWLPVAQILGTSQAQRRCCRSPRRSAPDLRRALGLPTAAPELATPTHPI